MRPVHEDINPPKGLGNPDPSRESGGEDLLDRADNFPKKGKGDLTLRFNPFQVKSVQNNLQRDE
jgi:hypothetical protein